MPDVPPPAGQGPASAPMRTVYAFSFASAIAALVYQVAWTRLLALPFGRTTLAASAVVAGFMGGMALGAWLVPRFARTGTAGALRLYALLELGIAVSAVALTAVFVALPNVFAQLAPSALPGVLTDLGRIGIVLVLLVVPAAFMGATYPALCMILIHTREGVARHLGRIYGLNTLGAAAGALVAGLVLLETLGLRGAVLAAAALNLAIAVSARRLAARWSGAGAADADVTRIPQAEAVLPTALSRRVTGLVLVGSGFATLAYEIVWFRALQYLFGNSTYALTVMLVVFLLGLGLGALLFGPVVRRGRPEWALARCQLAIGVLALLAIGGEALVLADPERASAVSVFSAAVGARHWLLRLVAGGALAIVLMLPATLAMGLSFPLATRLYLGDVRRLGAGVGASVVLANAGSIAGSVTAALWILPRWGTVGGTMAIATLNLALGLGVASRLDVSRRGIALGLGALATAALVAALLPPRLPFRGEGAQLFAHAKLGFEEEGDLATVQVWEGEGTPPRRAMMIDGVTIAVSPGGFYPIYSKQRLLAHLALAIDPGIRTALNVGLGSGSTVHALVSYPTVERVDAVEISDAVARASRHFAESAALDDPRVRLVVEDVMHFLLRGGPDYDLILSDGKQNADFSSNWAMMSREFYTAALARLGERGLFVQWIPTSTLADDFRTTLRTFLGVFPEAGAFVDTPHSVFLVGSRSPLAGRGRWRPDVYARLPAARDLARFRIAGPERLLARWVGGQDALAVLAGDGPESRWNHTPLEFAAYRSSPEEKIDAPRANLAALDAAATRDARQGGSPFAPPGSPQVRSTRLVRRYHLANLEGRSDEAPRLLERAVRADPEDPLARWLLEQQAGPGGSP